jgi:carboxyl-terminal processing protease
MLRRLAPLLVLLLLLAGASASAAQPRPRLSPAAQQLAHYLPTQADLPPGVRIQAGPIEGTNEDFAAVDPDNAELIYRHGRFTEAFEQMRRGAGPGVITASVVSWRDSDGAWADALATTDSFTNPALAMQRTLPGPAVGERSVLFRLSTSGTAAIEAFILVLQRDRLKVEVALTGPRGSVSVNEILPIARIIDENIERAPPGPPTDAERAVFEEPTPAVLVRGAVRLLLNEFYQPVEVDELLREAWAGATRALERAGVSSVPPAPNFSTDEDAAIDLHMRSFPLLEALAAGRISQQELAYAAIAELVDRRDDCHTSHLSRQRWETFKARQEGAPAVQIGVSFTSEKPLRVVSVLPNSPAERAGLRPGQEIVAINGQAVAAFSITEARALIDPREGAQTAFTVRNPSGRMQEITVAPETFAIPDMESRILPGNIGYLTFYGFNTNDEQLVRMREILTDWESQGVVGWIIDLRRNSGGSSALMNQMISLFVNGGRLYATVERGEEPVFVNADPRLTLPFQRPLVFLAGPGSASAGEIMPGALWARGRAVIVGETTNGCIGGFIPRGLLDGSAFNPTRIEILIGPDALRLHRQGVSPNVYAPVTPEDAEAGRDPGLPAAVTVITELAGGGVPVGQAAPAPPQRPRALIFNYD